MEWDRHAKVLRMSGQNIDQLLRTQNETITELIAISKDCVNACHAVLNRLQVEELREETNSLRRSQVPVTRELKPRETRLKGSAWQEAAREMYLEQNQRASDISMMLRVPYASVHQFLKSIDGYPIKKHGSRVRKANYSHRDR